MNPRVKLINEQPTNPKKKVKCDFCNKSELNTLMWGQMYQLDGVTVHYFCMLFSSGLSQNGEDDEGIFGFLPKDIRKETNRGKKLKCKYCKTPGATIGCFIKKCKMSFHYTCGLEKGCLFQFIGGYEAYCPTHRNPIVISIPEEMRECPICQDKLDGDSTEPFPIKPPCCDKSNAVYHRACMMKTALMAGLHFFKCPMCNDRDKFSEAMRFQGIYVPDKDAEWETEPNAFAELTEQYNRCDIQPCLCPHGREFSSSDGGNRNWKLLRCGGCGAAAVHLKCGNLPNLTYRCEICANALIGINIESDDENSPTRQRREYQRTPGRISRRRLDSDSHSDEDGPVHDINILEKLPPPAEGYSNESEYESEEEEEEEESEEEKVVEIVRQVKSGRRLPKRKVICGRTYKVTELSFGDKESDCISSEDEEGAEETEHDFRSTEITSSNDSLRAEVRTGLVEVTDNRGTVVQMIGNISDTVKHSDRRVRQQVNFLDIKPPDKVELTPENAKFAEIAEKIVSSLKIPNQQKQKWKSQLPITASTSTAKSFQTTTTGTVPGNCENVTTEEPITNKDTQKIVYTTGSKNERKEEIKSNESQVKTETKTETAATDEGDDDDLTIECVLVNDNPSPSRKPRSPIKWMQHVSTAYKNLQKKSAGGEIEQKKLSNGEIPVSAILRDNFEASSSSKVVNVVRTETTAGTASGSVAAVEIITIDTDSDEEGPKSPVKNGICGTNGKCNKPKPNRDQDQGCSNKRVREEESVDPNLKRLRV